MRKKQKVRLETRPGDWGDVLAESLPIQSQNWGRIYVIELRRPVAVSGAPMPGLWESGKRDEW